MLIYQANVKVKITKYNSRISTFHLHHEEHSRFDWGDIRPVGLDPNPSPIDLEYIHTGHIGRSTRASLSYSHYGCPTTYCSVDCDGIRFINDHLGTTLASIITASQGMLPPVAH